MQCSIDILYAKQHEPKAYTLVLRGAGSPSPVIYSQTWHQTATLLRRYGVSKELIGTGKAAFDAGSKGYLFDELELTAVEVRHFHSESESSIGLR
jgi:hypothetical protein